MSAYAPLILSGVAASSSLAEGKLGAMGAKFEAKQLARARKDEELAGRDRALRIKEELASTLATQRVLLAARGVDPGSALGFQLAQSSQGDAKRDVLAEKFNTSRSVGEIDTQIGQARMRGAASRFGGQMGAAGSFANALMQYQRIGTA
jgi:hypothetical protein